jgi:hypothetical protein
MFLKAKALSSDVTTFLTLFTDFTVQSIQDLVNQVQYNCERGGLQELALYAHGTNGSFNIGLDSMGIMTPAEYDSKIAKFGLLWPYFCSANSTGRARLVFCICEAGKNPDVMVDIAKAIGQPVYACDGDVRPTLGVGLGWWCGNTIEAVPENGGSWRYVSGIPDPPVIFA